MDEISTYLHNELKQIPFDLYNIISKYIEFNKGTKVAFVGGHIRDLLIRKFHKSIFPKQIDIDIVIEGSSLSLAKYIKKNIKNIDKCLIKEFNLYKTVELNIDNLKIDIASARKEIYNAPGSNPIVNDTSIQEDLKRRDFTINAIAFEVSKKRIYDLYQGVSHIQTKQLHLLHEESIRDDPSRVIRCAKYASRFGFRISENSLKQSREAVKEWPWKSSKNQNKQYFPPAISIRIRMELSEIYKHDHLTKIIFLLNQWGIISILNNSIEVDSKFLRGLNWIKKLKGKYFLFLLRNEVNLDNACQRFLINNKEKKILEDYLDIRKILELKKEKYLNLSASSWTEFIERKNLDIETVKLLICDGGLFWRPLFKWLFIYRFIKSKKSGELLKKEGWQPGKEMGAEIKRLRYLEIDKKGKN